MVAKKHKPVASAIQTELGGSTYPESRQWIEIPRPVGLIKRATRANVRRIKALITNSSEGFILVFPVSLV